MFKITFFFFTKYLQRYFERVFNAYFSLSHCERAILMEVESYGSLATRVLAPTNGTKIDDESKIVYREAFAAEKCFGR